MRALATLALLASAPLALAKVLPVDERCVTSVSTAYGYIPFVGPSKYYDKRCRNPLAVASMYASADIFCTSAERAAGFTQLENECRELGLDLISRDQVAENLTDGAISRMRVVDYMELPMDEKIGDPVLLSPSHYSRVFKTMDTWAFEVWTHYTYGYLGYLYWGCVLSVGIINRLLQHFFSAPYDHQAKAPSTLRYSPFRRAYHWMQTQFVVSPTIPSYGRQFLWWTFSNRIEAVVALGFWALSIVLCSISYRLFPENIYWTEPAQLIRYMADRTGIISFANLPLLWLFAGRNNICAWATGWNFATFNVFHRHVAWIATIQAVLHTVLYLVLFFQNSNPWRKLQKPYLLWGTLATVLMVLILPAAVHWFRHRAYETFLFIHILFSIGLLVGCFYHTIIFEDQEYWFYLWPPVAIWAFDRVLRVIRALICNFHVRIHSGRGVQYTTSTASYSQTSDLIRLDVVPGSNFLQPRPGDYYFLYQPFRITGWESHPFTLGSWSYEIGRNASSPSTPRTRKSDEHIDVSQVPLLSEDSFSGTRSPTIQTPKSEHRELKLTFWIRPYDGWTRHLRQRCLNSPDHTSNATILLEGPYGHEFPLWSYDSVLLIAGGTGIASAVPYIQDHIARSSASASPGSGIEMERDLEVNERVQSTNANTEKTHIQNMHLIWVTRQPAFIHQLTSGSGELAAALERDDFQASFYATSTSSSQQNPTQQYPSRGSLADTVCPTQPQRSQELNILPGRPDLKKLVSAFAEEAHNSDSSAAVLVCGPQRMADEARGAVLLAMRMGCAVRYVEESFTW